MCLSTVFTVCDGVEEKVAEHVTHIAPQAQEIVLTTIMGTKQTVPGRISDIDLVNNVIRVERV